ncbi:hypothetical protein [Bosea sp. RAC05]|uniref:hypothetical protein n=1 Tax=Bosea sp. RAC05 TaxID=1842539 RepID=UPI00083CBC72|nr:hypothetical protein [Bosea sp. RAC05]AOG03144.1 winged helix-turn-helix DNA-binding family protein [Bosea sp. RAC05]
MHGTRWTPELDAEIIRLRRDEKLTAKKIALRVDRKVGAVFARFRNLDALVMERREWSADEVARLHELLGDETITIRDVAVRLGRNEAAVRWKLDHLGIKPGRRLDWTPEQLDMLRDALLKDPDISNRAIAGMLGRAESGVSAKITELGLRPQRIWSEIQVAQLKAAASAEAAAEATGRDLGSVRAKATALGIRFQGSIDRSWTDEADGQLKALLEERGSGANALGSIASDLGRTSRAIRLRGLKLGLIGKARRRRPMDEAGRAEIAEAARSGISITIASQKLGRDVRTLKAIADEMGLAFKAAPRGPALKRPAVVKPVAAIGGASVRIPSAIERETKREMIRLAAEATVPVRRIEAVAKPIGKAKVAAPAKPPGAVAKRPVVEPMTAKAPVLRVLEAQSVAGRLAARAAPAVEKPERAEAPRVEALPARVEALPAIVKAPAAPRRNGKSSFGSIAPVRRGKDGGRDAALAIQASTADAVARFLAERGVTRAVVDPVEGAITAIRARGYSLVRVGDGFMIDGRVSLEDTQALLAFANERRIPTPGFMQAAE